MKTKSSHGLLVYFDDEGFCDFLELLILNGKLSLRFSIFCAEPATVVSDTAVNDSQWHAVTIRRNFKNTTLKVDNETKWVEVKSKRRDMTVFSHLFVGGIPPELRSEALRLTSSTVKDQLPFTGWITDIKVNKTESVMINSDGVLKDLCGPANICLNGGICSLINNEPTCDCSRTGFQGKDCSEGVLHPPKVFSILIKQVHWDWLTYETSPMAYLKCMRRNERITGFATRPVKPPLSNHKLAHFMASHKPTHAHINPFDRIMRKMNARCYVQFGTNLNCNVITFHELSTMINRTGPSEMQIV
ncbi:Neurexin-1a [Dissostichus eleginoides]|nr:Neurexin-1a [Dissostichus eleginoides]